MTHQPIVKKSVKRTKIQCKSTSSEMGLLLFYTTRYVIIVEILDMIVYIAPFLKFYILHNYFVNILNKRETSSKRYIINEISCLTQLIEAKGAARTRDTCQHFQITSSIRDFRQDVSSSLCRW